MKDDFSKYEGMRDSGSSAEQVYQEALRDGHDPISRIRLIRAVFSLSPHQAKEVFVRAEGEADSLDEFQGRIADAVTKERRKTSSSK